MSKAQSTYYTYTTAHGPITVRTTARGVAQVVFGQEKLEGTRMPSELSNAAATQIQEYLAGKRRVFSLPLDPEGSAFQKAVWTEVCNVDYGCTCLASDIANAMGKPGSHRSVGTAIRQNQLAPLIPTHRVDIPNATGKQANIYRAFQSLEARNGKS